VTIYFFTHLHVASSGISSHMSSDILSDILSAIYIYIYINIPSGSLSHIPSGTCRGPCMPI
jgi:hypothetical protein